MIGCIEILLAGWPFPSTANRHRLPGIDYGCKRYGNNHVGNRSACGDCPNRMGDIMSLGDWILAENEAENASERLRKAEQALAVGDREEAAKLLDGMQESIQFSLNNARWKNLTESENVEFNQLCSAKYSPRGGGFILDAEGERRYLELSRKAGGSCG